MNDTTAFLKEQTISGANKIRRTPMPSDWSVANEKGSIAERKSLGLKMIFDNMPLFIGEKELIVGTRTFFAPNPKNKDGRSHYDFGLNCGVPYINEDEIKLFGANQSFANKTHYTPDYGILLNNGIKGISDNIKARQEDKNLSRMQEEFLSSVETAYKGLHNLINRYANYALQLSKDAPEQDKSRLCEISRICKKISYEKPDSFAEAVQLLWFGHLGAIIESFEFINYGRLDVILAPFLKDTPKIEAQQILECFLLKTYDQVDINASYLKKYGAQLVVTLGGILANGENAVNDVTMLFLDAIDNIRLPEPEFNLRLNSKNPPEFLDKAAQLTISGCNFISYYNDDLFVQNLTDAGIPVEIAREYGFDLCQDITIPGKADFYCCGEVSLAYLLMDILTKNSSFESYDELVREFKSQIAERLQNRITHFNMAQKQVFEYRDGSHGQYFANIKANNMPIDWWGRSPMSPLPYLSGLFYGTIENAADIIYESYPVKEKGVIFGTAPEAVNSLAAIKQTVYDTKQYTLQEVMQACLDNYSEDGQQIMRSILWNSPKWGNDEAYVDNIAKDILEFCLKECKKYKTFSNGGVLGGIHQPHPVPTGEGLMATPEGRYAKTPVAVTLTPENGTMRKGPTAVLNSAAKLDYTLIQWNFCVMVNYFASVFKGNDGAQVFKDLINGYFKNGGLQHQPNILDMSELKAAQAEPAKYKDLIVRLWGVSAHFVDLPKELQDEMISRFTA